MKKLFLAAIAVVSYCSCMAQFPGGAPSFRYTPPMQHHMYFHHYYYGGAGYELVKFLGKSDPEAAAIATTHDTLLIMPVQMEVVGNVADNKLPEGVTVDSLKKAIQSYADSLHQGLLLALEGINKRDGKKPDKKKKMDTLKVTLVKFRPEGQAYLHASNHPDTRWFDEKVYSNSILSSQKAGLLLTHVKYSVTSLSKNQIKMIVEKRPVIIECTNMSVSFKTYALAKNIVTSLVMFDYKDQSYTNPKNIKSVDAHALMGRFFFSGLEHFPYSTLYKAPKAKKKKS